jgi:ubiquinone/menaquinone biosynthesis methyltransferase
MLQKIKQILESSHEKKVYNEQLFTIVAPRYDLITKILSLGQDGYWKKKLIQALPNNQQDQAQKCVDLACGTGDITFMLAKKYPNSIIDGIDLTPSMLVIAEKKLDQKQNILKNVFFKQADMCLLPYDNESIDIVTGGYALRNAPSLDRALVELFRVLKAGGTAAFLDFSKPKNKFLQKTGYYVLKIWGGLWGILLHRDHTVYSYIAESLAAYPDREALRLLLKKHGFYVKKSKLFFCGFLELLVCTKIDPREQR